jgi:hypothetical protein
MVSVGFLNRSNSTHLAQEPRNQVAKDNGLIGLGITRRRRNASTRPQVALPLIQISVSGARVKQQHPRGTVNQPPTINRLDAPVVHRLDGRNHGRVLGLQFFDLDRDLFSALAKRHADCCAERTEFLLSGPNNV